MVLSACAGDVAMDVTNLQAAQELARSSRPPGSVYSGWRVFKDKCSACHGTDAVGAETGPDLMPLIQRMGPRRFVGLVLKRYDWNNLQPTFDASNSESLEALTDTVMRRKEPAIQMPAWEGSPSVNFHILDLYAYLTARAEGVQGTGRPPL